MQWKQFKKLTEQLWGVTYSPNVTTESTTRGLRIHHHTRLLNKTRIIVTELADGKVRALKCFYEDFSIEMPMIKETSKSIKSNMPMVYEFLTTMIK